MPAFFTILHIATHVFGIFTNSLAQYVICTTKRAFADSISIMVANLSVANIIYLAASLGLSIANKFDTSIESSFQFPEIFCPILKFLINASFCVPTMIFVLIAMERFLEILSPIAHDRRFNTKVTTHYMVIVWIFGLIISTPYMLFCRVETTKKTSKQKCYVVNYKDAFWDYYRPAYLVLTFVLPVLFSGSMLAVSACLVSLQNRLARDTSGTTTSSSINTGISVMVRLRKTVLKTLLVSLIIFVFGYAPAAVKDFLFMFDVEMAVWINEIGTVLLTLSVSAFPIMFASCSYFYQKRVMELKQSVRDCAWACVGIVNRRVQNPPATSGEPQATTETAAVRKTTHVRKKIVPMATNVSSHSNVIPDVPITHVRNPNDLDGRQSNIWRITIHND